MQELLRSGQWVIRGNVDTGEYELVNPNPSLDPNAQPQRRFFRVFAGPHGQPVIEPEPDLAFSPPTGVKYVDRRSQEIVPDQKIAGVICRETDGTTAKSVDGQVNLRLSLTNALSKGISYHISSDGELEIGGRKFWLQVLVSKDKNRFRNYDAYFGPVKPDQVKVLELEDLVPIC